MPTSSRNHHFINNDSSTKDHVNKIKNLHVKITFGSWKENVVAGFVVFSQ